jgi:SNF2 family DNA or RNA helicase
MHILASPPHTHTHCSLKAIARIYRIGQTRPAFVYRLVLKGTYEDAIYRLSLDKEVGDGRLGAGRLDLSL